MIFLDTSAILAVLDADDHAHTRAKATWHEILEKDTPLISSNYILVETTALLQHRFGLEAVKTFHEDIVPLLRVEWIDEELHNSSMIAVLMSGRKKLSLVDCTSFALMRNLGIKKAFAFDKHFKEQGFET